MRTSEENKAVRKLLKSPEILINLDVRWPQYIRLGFFFCLSQICVVLE